MADGPVTAPPAEDPFVRAARLESELSRAREELATIKATLSFRLANAFITAASRVGRRRADGAGGADPRETGAPARVVVVAVDADARRVGDAVAAVARLMPERPLRALFVVTSDDLAPLSAAGIEYEYVPSASDYRREFPDRDYGAFVDGRLADACAWFGPDVVLDIDLLTRYPSAVRALLSLST